MPHKLRIKARYTRTVSKGYLVKVVELDQVFAAKPGVVVTALRPHLGEHVLELELERAPLKTEDETP